MNTWHLILLLSAIPVMALAQSDKVTDRITSLEAGVVCPPESVGSAPAPNTVAGETHIIEVEPPFVSTSRRVPAVLGIGFGVKAQTAVERGLDDVTMVVTHPPMGDDAIAVQSFGTRISGVDPSLTFYQFDFSYELLPGTWQMAAMHEGEVLYNVAFEVLPPSEVPELAAVCGYLDLLS